MERAHGEETGRAGKGEQIKKGQLLELQNGNSKDETRTSGIFSFYQHHIIYCPMEGTHWDGLVPPEIKGTLVHAWWCLLLPLPLPSSPNRLC